MSSRRGRETVFTRDFILACVANLGFFSSFQILLAVLPLYVVHIGGAESEVGLVMGIIMFSSLIARPFSGRVVDIHAKALFLIGGSAVAVVAAALYTIADNVMLLLVIRAAQGVAVAFSVTAVYSMLADIVPPSRRGEAIGIYGTSNNIALALAPAAGAAILAATNFRTVFMTGAASALVCLVLVTWIKAARQPAAIEENAPIKGFDRNAVYPAALAWLLFYSYGAVSGLLALYTAARGLGNAGVFFTVCAIGMIISRFVTGPLSDRYGRVAIVCPGSLLMAGSLIVLMFATSVEMLAISGFLYGFGFGGSHPSLIAMVADRVAHGRRGVAMSIVGVGTDSGWAIGGMASGVIVQYAGFNWFFVVSIATAVAGPALMLLHRRQARGIAQPATR